MPLSDPKFKRNFKAVVSSLREPIFSQPFVFGHFLTAKYARFTGDGFARRPNHTYITFLRDPLQRAISHYRYWCRSDGRGNRAWERMQREKWSLEQFLCSRYFANIQSQFLWGFGLEQFHFVGVADQYAKSLLLLGEQFPVFRDLPALHSNQSPARDETVEVPSAVQAKFKTLNQRDYEIYHQAVAGLEVSLCRAERASSGLIDRPHSRSSMTDACGGTFSAFR